MPADISAELPSHCLRGLRKKEWVDGSLITTLAFLPDRSTGDGRTDGMTEASINWEDDGSAIAFTLDRRAQSEHGIARLPRDEIDRVRRIQHCAGKLSYERSVIDGNPFHGNLLYAAGCGRPLEKMIASALALESTYIPR